ncbi:hypothetical protein MAPG_06251 [Magnaporthiopsis poae ATCC 64411]|uniref:Ankyrin repeat protein n=1 Tax=Magnaporthiopsis poae (strain ATCC 64411 / 73-15) TaxID=644358 RepID=A0A0C4E1I9_MAGP6|nr:hypothetical protein MAPG_06251 [Magnaporthiopsis poae ATCC 64411]
MASHGDTTTTSPPERLAAFPRRPPLSNLERLLPELMMMVLYETDLGLADLSRLARTSWALYGQVLPRLLASDELKNKAMQRALARNISSLVDKVVLYGGPVSTVVSRAEWTSWGTRWPGTGRTVLTLGLTARQGSFRAFKRLVELGARVDCPEIDIYASRSLISSIVQPSSSAFLKIFLDGDLETATENPPLVSQLPQHQLDAMLYHVAEMQNYKHSAWTASSCVDFAKRLITAGADPNPSWVLLEDPKLNRARRRCRRRGIFLPTLSAAIISRSVDLVRLLLESGASVEALDHKFFTVLNSEGRYPGIRDGGSPDPLPHEKKTTRRPGLANHGPLFAVAYALADSLSRTGDASERAKDFQKLAEITDMCVKRGAKVNVSLPMQVNWAMRYRTPLMLYLAAVRDWKPCGGSQPGSDAIQRLQYLIGIGASPVVFDDKNTTKCLPRMAIFNAGHIIRSGLPDRSPDAREILMERETSPAQALLEAWCPLGSALPLLVNPLKILLAPMGLQTDGIRPVDLLASYRYAATAHPVAPEQQGSADTAGATECADPVISAWNSIMTEVIRHLSPSDLDMLLADYIFLKATCDRRPHDGRSGGLTGSVERTTSPAPIALTAERARLFRFLIGECGADPAARCHGWTLPAILASGLGEEAGSIDQAAEEYNRLVRFDWNAPGAGNGRPWLVGDVDHQ